MGVISWIFLGLIAGLIAKILMPGKDPGGLIITALLGIAGAFFGGWVGSLIGVGEVGSFTLGGVVTAVVGAMILLLLYRMIKK